MMSRPFLQAIVLTFVASFAVSAAAQTAVPDAKPEAKGPGATVDGKPPEKPSDYSQEGFVYELYRTAARFEADGTGVREYSARVRVQSEAGVQALGQLVFGYNSANERMEINYVRVRKSAGNVVTATADAVQDLTAPVQREAPVYTDYRQKHITVPALRPGEILEYRVTATLHTPYAAGQFWFNHDFEKRVIMLDEQFELSIPRNREIKLKTKPEFKPEISEQDGRRVYLWKSTNLKRESDDDDDKKKARKRRKSRDSEFSDVQITTFHTWDEVGKWYAALERDRIRPTPAIAAKAAELTKDRKTDQEKLEAIYDYVAKNFRYVSLSLGLGRYQPHAASDVLANQYGDCKDKHTLLSALLRAAGMQADAVLINSTRKLDPDVPSPSQFDHLISAVPLGPQKLFWLDTTTEVAPFGLLSMTLRDKQALLVTQGETARLIETPPDPPFAGEQTLEINGKVSELGKLTAHAKFTLRGDAELIARVTFRRIPESQWKRVARIFAATIGLPGDVEKFNVEDPAETKNPFVFEFDVAAANYLDWTSKRSQLDLPIGLMAMPEFGGEEIEGEEEEDESEPLKLGGPGVVLARFKLELPAKFSVRLPVPVSIKRDFAEYRSNYKLDGHTVSGERMFRVLTHKLPRARSNEYGAFRRAVLADRSQRLLLETTTASGATIPEGMDADELHDAGRAAITQMNYVAAVELLKRAVEKEPKHKYAWNNLGLAYLGQRKFDQAISAFNKQLEVNPYDEYAYNNLGRVHMSQTNYPAAAEAFQKQIEINPLDRTAHGSLGWILLEQKKYPQAAEALEKAVAIAPEDARGHVMLGRAELNLGNSEKALAAFDKALELAPAHYTWNEIAYELSLRKVHLDRAQRYAESAVATTSALLRNSQLEQLGPTQLALVDSLSAEWDTLGWIHFQTGNLDLAEKYVRAAWRLSQHAEVGDHLSQIYERRGNKELAVRTQALAVNGVRSKPEVRERLVALAGGTKQADALSAKHRTELEEQRALKLGKLVPPAKQARSAEFMVLLSPAGVAGVKFLSGDEALRAASDALRMARYPVEFPDSTETKVARRGVLSCDVAGTCKYVLYQPEEVTSAE